MRARLFPSNPPLLPSLFLPLVSGTPTTPGISFDSFQPERAFGLRRLIQAFAGFSGSKPTADCRMFFKQRGRVPRASEETA
jgi:hypothetical protein